MSAGIALFVITAIRLKSSNPWKGLFRALASGTPFIDALKPVLLLTVFVATISGIAIFQKPPFGRGGQIFGLLPMPTVIRLDHSIHNIIISLHIALACIIVMFLLLHMVIGLRQAHRGGGRRFTVMLWPWRTGD